MQIPRAGSMQILRLLQSPPEGKKHLPACLFQEFTPHKKILKCYKYLLRRWRGMRCRQHDAEKLATGIQTRRASAQGQVFSMFLLVWITKKPNKGVSSEPTTPPLSVSCGL